MSRTRLLIIGTLLVVGLGYLATQFPISTPKVTPVPVAKELTREEQIRAVVYFCDIKYHKESCIHHMIKCGDSCIHFVSVHARERMVSDYKTLRRESRLASETQDAQ